MVRALLKTSRTERDCLYRIIKLYAGAAAAHEKDKFKGSHKTMGGKNGEKGWRGSANKVKWLAATNRENGRFHITSC